MGSSVEVLDIKPESIHIPENVLKLQSEETSQSQSVEKTISEKPSRIPIKKKVERKVEETENVAESKYLSCPQQEFDLKMSPEIGFEDSVKAERDKSLSLELKSDVIEIHEAQDDAQKIVKPEVKVSPKPVLQENFESSDSVKPVVKVISQPKDEISESEVDEKTKPVVPISSPSIESLKNSFDEDVDSDAEFELLEQALKKEEKLKLQEENQGAKNTLQNLLSANALKTDLTPFEDSIEGMIESDHDSEPEIESDPIREEKNESMSTHNDLISESIAIFGSDSSSDEDLAEQAIIVDHTLNTSDRRKSRISQDGENINGLAEDEKCRRKAELEKEEISHKENETKWFKVLQDLTNKSAKIEMEQDEVDDRAKNVEADLRNAMNSKNQRLEVELTGEWLALVQKRDNQVKEAELISKQKRRAKLEIELVDVKRQCRLISIKEDYEKSEDDRKLEVELVEKCIGLVKEKDELEEEIGDIEQEIHEQREEHARKMTQNLLEQEKLRKAEENKSWIKRSWFG